MWLAGKEKRWETNPSKNVANPVSEISKFVDEIFVALNFIYLQDGPPCLPLFQGLCITLYLKLLFDGSAHPLRIAFYVHFLSFCFKLHLSYGCDWLMHC
jgi:hypothetical protein